MMGDFSSEAYVLETERLEAENKKLEAENKKLRSMLYDFEKGITSARDTLNFTIIKYLESLIEG